MCRCTLSLFTALAIVLTPSYLAAEEGKRPHRQGPSPERMFQRLDANHDEVVTADELPADMPERFKKMLLRADADGDGKLTIGELRKSFELHRDKGRAEGRPMPEQPKKHAAADKGKDPKKFAKAIFVRLDKDKNGQLCFEEFADGLRQFHRMWISRGKQFGKAMQQCRRPEFAEGRHAMAGKPHDWRMHAEGPRCFCCMVWQMGPGTHPGMMPGGMGPWEHQNMQFGMNPWRRPGMHHGMGPWQGHFPKQSWGEGFPDGPKQMKHWAPDGKKKEWFEGPEPKRPKGMQFKTGEDSGDERIMRIEARLTALERQQEAMLVAIQEQQAAMMAALERTNELVSAKLASLGRRQERVRPRWDEARPERERKELARAYDGDEQPEEPYDYDRD